MNAFLIGPDAMNSTDGVIVEGIKNLLEDSGIHRNNIDYYFLDDFATQKNYNFNPFKKYDLFIICGTPWLWDQFQHSIKYKNMITAIDTHPEAKVIFMGIGSCVGLGWENTEIMRREEDKDAIRYMFSRGLVITRDHLAHEYLNDSGINNYFLPCPAYYCYGVNRPKFKKEDRNVMIYYTAEIGVSKTTLDGEYFKKINDTFSKFFLDEMPEIYCASRYEIPMAEKIGINTPILLQGWRDTLEKMKSAKKVLSGRVHCAVPAISAGTKVELIPVDSRHFVIEDFKNKDVFNYISSYRKILKEYIYGI